MHYFFRFGQKSLTPCCRRLCSDSKPHASQRTLILSIASAAAAIGSGLAWLTYSRARQRKHDVIKDPNFSVSFHKVNGFLLPSDVFNSLKAIQKFPANASDVFVVSYPKSGTTWVQEIVYLVMTDCDIKAARLATLEERFPFLEYPYPGVSSIRNMKSPRLIKSHLPLPCLPSLLTRDENPQGKIIYIARNPKDTMVSYYHFLKMLKPLFGYDSDFSDFSRRFIENGHLPYHPWDTHVTQFWEYQKSSKNILFLTYEELSSDTRTCVVKIADFLGKNLSKKQVDLILSHCSFENMKANPSTNFWWWRDYGIKKPSSGFYRSGKVGGWTEYLTDSQSQQMDILTKEMKTNFSFPFYSD